MASSIARARGGSRSTRSLSSAVRDLDPDAPVRDLSVADQQLVEIARAMATGSPGAGARRAHEQSRPSRRRAPVCAHPPPARPGPCRRLHLAFHRGGARGLRSRRHSSRWRRRRRRRGDDEPRRDRSPDGRPRRRRALSAHTAHGRRPAAPGGRARAGIGDVHAPSR